MMTDEISEFLEKIDSEHFNCVYSCNGMTLIRTEEYSNRLEEITELKREVNKYKQNEKYFKNNIDAVKKVCSVLKEDVFAYSSLKEAGIVLKKCGFKKVYTDNNNITKWRFEYGK